VIIDKIRSDSPDPAGVSGWGGERVINILKNQRDKREIAHLRRFA